MLLIFSLLVIVVGGGGVDVDGAVLHVIVVVDGAGEQMGRGAVGELLQVSAEEEGVGDHHLPRGGQAGALVDSVVVLLLLLVIDIDEALHPAHSKIANFTTTTLSTQLI